MAIQRKRICLHCKAEFTTSQMASKYCSDDCKAAVKNAKARKTTQLREERRVSRLRRTGFGQYLVAECMRAGSVQILTHHTSETLHELSKLRSDCFLSNGGGDVKLYELSHICPVNSKLSVLGLLHPHNIVIASKAFNRKRGTSYSGGGLSIPRLSLKAEWKVSKDTPLSQVYSKIEKFLGDVLKKYLADHTPTLSYKERIISSLVRKHLATMTFDSVEDKKACEDKTRRILGHYEIEKLEKLAAEKEISLSMFNVGMTNYLPTMVYEVRRFKSYGVEIDSVFSMYAEYLYSCNDFCSDNILDIESYDPLENEWCDPSLQYWMAEQLNALLHKEKPNQIFNAKHYTKCFKLPATVSADWKPSHQIEQILVAQYGMPEVFVFMPDSLFLIPDNVSPWDEANCPF